MHAQNNKRGDFAVLFGHRLCRRLLFLLSVRGQLPFKKGGLNSQVVYIDSRNTFDPYAVSAIAQEYGLEPKSLLERILISRAFTAYQLTALVFEELEKVLKRYRSKLVIVSDITGLFLDRE
jgi:DNA repair protein RadA